MNIALPEGEKCLLDEKYANDRRIERILAERDEVSKDPSTPRIPVDEVMSRMREKVANL